MTEHFKIQGPTIDGLTLYWSSLEDKWVSFASAYTYSPYVVVVAWPKGATGLAVLNPDGTIQSVGELQSVIMSFPKVTAESYTSVVPKSMEQRTKEFLHDYKAVCQEHQMIIELGWDEGNNASISVEEQTSEEELETSLKELLENS
jgi:hypothetical protein